MQKICTWAVCWYTEWQLKPSDQVVPEGIRLTVFHIFLTLSKVRNEFILKLSIKGVVCCTNWKAHWDKFAIWSFIRKIVPTWTIASVARAWCNIFICAMDLQPFQKQLKTRQRAIMINERHRTLFWANTTAEIVPNKCAIFWNTFFFVFFKKKKEGKKNNKKPN